MASATSELAETGRSVSRLALFVALLSNIETRYGALKAGASYHKEWAARMAALGQPVRASGEAQVTEGTAVGVDEDGALLVQVADGSVQRVLAGDVTLREVGIKVFEPHQFDVVLANSFERVFFLITRHKHVQLVTSEVLV